MTTTPKERDMDRLPRAVVLGAGASRSVSYAHEREQPSPLDSDFFDLLNRLEPHTEDIAAVQFVRKQIQTLPHDYRRSMERSFYTLQLRAYMAEKLKATHNSGPSDDEIVANFDADTLRDFSQQRFPDAALPSDAGSRVAGVGRFRDTKALANSESEIVSLRVWRSEALLKNGKPFDAAALTLEHGVFSFLFKPSCPYALVGKCALTENPAVFVAAEYLNLSVDAAIYGHGRISSRALDWLAHTTNSKFSLLHLPDYDPLGLSEFQRLHARLGKRVALYLPSDLELRFARFSNPELLKKANSQAMLARLRRSELVAIRPVVALIDRYNAGLEQEALLIPS